MCETLADPAFALPCGYVFRSGGLCHTGPMHPVHVGGWNGPEPQHDYEPEERRSGHDRRALVFQPDAEGGGRSGAHEAREARSAFRP
jgi:hypothetical protein